MLYVSYDSADEQVRGVDPIILLLTPSIESPVRREGIQCLSFWFEIFHRSFSSAEAPVTHTGASALLVG